MRIYDNKALLLKVRNPQMITTVIPKSKLLPSGEVAVRWGLQESHVLKNIGIRNVPSPITANYGWPGLHKPFNHQHVTAEFLTMHKRAFCFNEAGTGKTSAAIWAADYLMNIGEIARVLVVCPLSIMDAAWRGDMFKTAMHRKVDIAHGNAKKRQAVIESDAEFVITNFDTVVNSNELLRFGGFDLVIVDEASNVKNSQTARWKSLKKLIGPDTWLWMMTGTPAAQSPADAFGLAKLVNPQGCPAFFTAFRDMVMNKVSPFRYLPKPEAKTIVHNVLQPAIRFEKKDCLDLPPVVHVTRKVELTPQQKKYYDILKNKMVMEAAGEQVTAANAAVKLSKLLQVSCIAFDTPVLTSRGWVPIQTVKPTDRVWDGEEWVSQKGAVFKGVKDVVELDGVTMTSDHKVWVGSWVTAGEILNDNDSGRFTRPKVRLPDGIASRAGTDNSHENSQMGVPMRLRECGHSAEPVFKERAADQHKKLWLRETRKQKARVDKHSTLFDMVKDEITVSEAVRQRLGELRRSGYSGMRTVVGVVREFLARHAGGVLAGINFGQNQRQRELRTVQLQMGHHARTAQQHTLQRAHCHAEGGDDRSGRSKSLWDKGWDIVRSAWALRMVSSRRIAPTYDLRECGPRSRFVVKGEEGQLLIVHNCGAAYSDGGETIEFDISNRYNVLMEIISETTEKILIFVPFTNSIDVLAEKLTADGITNAVINGAVPASKRGDIIRSFQSQDDPRVLIIQPQAAAHGITLTAADTVVWWGPTASVEIFEQANARVDRPGQKNKCTVHRLYGSFAEWHVYNLLDTKRKTHSSIIDLYKKLLD